jgi:flagellar assembly protein FliH
MIMNDPAPKPKLQKYYFTANIFDEDHVEEPEIPPPPVFSEAELEAARLKSLQEGKQAGLKEAEHSQLKQVGSVMDRIARDMAVLFEAEAAREALFRAESVRLCLSIFEKLFPVFQAKYGFDEMKAALDSVLQKQEAQSQIVISVSPEIAEETQKHLTDLQARGLRGTHSVRADDSLPLGACKLAWENGGAFKSMETLAEEIKLIMEQALAGNGPTGHDKREPARIADNGEHS